MPPQSKVERTCEICGVPFLTVPSVVAKGRARFCSRGCYAKWLSQNVRGQEHPNWQGGKVERVCEICGSRFSVGRSIANKGGGKYCSWNCQHKAHKRFTRELNPNWKGARTICTCAACGKEFELTNAAIRHGEGRCCSRKCHGIWRSQALIGEKAGNWKGGPTLGTCLQCGKEIQVRAHRLKDNRDKFCSRECLHTWMGLNHRGENHHAWKGGRRPYPLEWEYGIKKVIRKRDGFKCIVCQKPEKKRGHDVHHIDYDKANLYPTNLITLCRSCHMKTNTNREYWKTYLAELLQ